MKSPETLEERQSTREMPDSDIQSTVHNKKPTVMSRPHRDPRRAAALSLIPGCGQLYNGETGKGLLFLGVTAANIGLLALLFGTEPLLTGITQLAAILHITPKLDIHKTLEIIHTGRAVTLVYLCLILSFVVYAMREAYDHAKQQEHGKSFARFVLTMPEATSGSYLAHFSIICALLILVVFVMAPPPPQKQSTDIELVQDIPEPPPPAPAKPKQEAKPAPAKVETPKPKPEPVKPHVVPPQPTPVAVAVPTDKPVADSVVQSNEPPAAQGGSDSGSTSAGGGNGNGDSGDGNGVDFGSYLAEIQKRIKKNWYPPRGEESKSCTLKFKIRKDGSSYAIKLVTSSGLAIVDQAAVTAIKTSSPFPNLPAGSPDEIDIKFTFDYSVFTGRRQAF
ncbi:MAG: TonB family protein [Candidatus Obscuribacterales bacterium]|nr:TonB family protein [Candidatus Obscuribacterales bacterium]